MKKHLKWIIPILALVLVGAAVAMVLLSGRSGNSQSQPEVQEEPAIEIYWNVERSKYIDSDGNSTRTRSGDYYRAVFAKDGEQLSLLFDNGTLLAYADTMLFVGLEFNEDNIVTTVHDVEDIYGGLAAYEYYVQAITDTEILCNSVGSFRGLPLTLHINENTQIYWAGDGDALSGLPGQVEVGSMIYALKDQAGYTTHIYVAPPFEPSPVYWNVERMYDSTTKLSSRTADALGYYVYTFAVNGEQVELRTTDFQVACQIDSFGAKCMHLEFDENGLITSATHARNATGGNTLASWYHITELNELENSFTAEKFSGSDKGSVATGTMSASCMIFDVSGQGAFIGEQTTELRVGDQVHCLRDPYGDVSVIFIISREVQSPIYWNVERMWDSTAKTSTRQPDSQGYYSFLLAVEGRQVTLRTKDINIVNSMDGRGSKCFALKVEGDEILAYYLPSATAHGITFASWCDVTAIDGDKVTAKRVLSGSDQGTIYEAEMASECKVYDTTGKSGFVGAETTLQVGDRIHGLAGRDGKIYTIFVVERTNPGPIYWNLDRSYDSKNKVTKRTPDADGYYVFKMAKGTETVTVKTKSKTIANELDSYVAAGMTLNGDIIVDCYKYSTINEGKGGGFASWAKVTAISGSSVTAGDKTATMAYGCKIYDVSQGSAAPVTTTTLKVGDQIHGILNSDGKLSYIYIISRSVVSPVYWNLDKTTYYDSTNKVTKRTPDADGYYVFKLADGTKTVTVKTKDQTLANTLDSYVAVGLELDGDVIQKVYKYSAVQGYGEGFASWTKVTAIDGSTVTAGDYTGTLAAGCKIYDVSGGSSVPVTETDLRVGDKIHGIYNTDKQVCLIYIIERPVTSPIYWNLDKTTYYDSTNKVTKRTPDADGYYVFKLAEGTKTVTFKTKDQGLANLLDSYVAVGLELDGDVIQKVYKYSAVQGYGDGFASWTKVTTIDGSTVTAGAYTGTLAAGCKIYNVSGGSSVPVAETDLRVGDKIHGIYNTEKQVCLIYIVERPVISPIYWNLDKTTYYDSTNKVTKRTPDADGYYVFKLAEGTKTVTVKTKDQTLANTLDSYVAVGLELDSDVIQKVYKYSAIQGYGDGFASWTKVTSIDGSTVTAGTYTGTLAQGYKVYNVSSGSSVPVTETDLRVGDKIHGIKNSAGQVALVYVVGRTTSKTGTCDVCGASVTWAAWNGSSTMSSGHYYLEADISVSKTATISKNTTVCLDLCGHNVTGASTLDRIFNIFGDFNLMDSVGSGTVTATYDNPAGRTGSVFYVQNSATSGYGTFSLYGGTLTSTGQTKLGGIGGVGNVFYMYGGTISGGTAAEAGGCVYIENSSEAQFIMLGGSISGGTAASAQDVRGAGKITLGGTAQIGELYLLSGKTVTLSTDTPLAEGAKIGIAMAVPGVFANVTGDLSAYFESANDKYVIGYSADDQTLSLVNKPHENHCVCGGVGAIGDHTCDESVVWEPWTGTWESGKYYYLTADLDLTTTLTVSKDQTLNLCLNGFTINGGASLTRIFNLYGTLNLCDCQDEGSVVSNYSGTNTSTGRIFYIQSSAANGYGVFNLYGGTLTSNSTTANGGIGGVSNVFNMYGGTISGGTATGNGGNINVENSAATVTILGGTISGGTAATAQDVRSIANMILGGTAQIGELYLTSGKTVTLSTDTPLAEGAKIGIAMAVPGVFAENVTGDLSAYFESTNDRYVISYSANDQTLSLTIKPHQDHCVCGGHTQGVGDHESCTDLTGWTVLTTDCFTASGSNLKLADGNYYLDADLTLSKAVNILPGQAVTICLNGYTITDSARVFRVNGTLNITDCYGSGKIVGNSTNAAIFYGYSGGQVNLYAGQLVAGNAGSTTRNYGGLGALGTDIGNASETGPSSFTMYGGSLVGTSVVKSSSNKFGSGGTLYIMSKCTFTMYDGTISGGSAAVSGGNVSAFGDTYVNLYGGSITGGTCAKGGDLYTTGTLALDGTIQIEDLYLIQDQKLDVSKLKDGTSIGLTMAVPGVFAEGVETDLTGYFHSVDPLYCIRYSETDKTLLLELDPNAHVHCICGGVGAIGDHTCDENVVWESWDGTAAMENGKYYYLTADVTLTETLRINGGDTVSLCLNGFKISGSTSVTRIFNLFGTFNLCDCQGNGSVVSNYSGTNTSSGRVFYVQNSATSGYGVFNLYGGTLTSNSTTTNGGIGGVGNHFNMYGGTISGGTATGKGGSVYMEKNNYAQFTMLGGTISGGSAPTAPGVYGTGNLEASIVLGGTAKIDNLYLISGKTVTLSTDTPLAEGAQIGIDMAVYGTFINGSFANTDLTYFLPPEGYQITADAKLEEDNE